MPHARKVHQSILYSENKAKNLRLAIAVLPCQWFECTFINDGPALCYISFYIVCIARSAKIQFVLSNLVLFDFFECVFIVCYGGGGGGSDSSSWLNAMHRMESTQQIQTKQRKTVDNFQCFFYGYYCCCCTSFEAVTCIRIIAITITSSTWLYYFGASTACVVVVVCIVIFLTGIVAWWVKKPTQAQLNRWS